MSQLDDIVGYSRNNVRDRERAAEMRRLQHEAVAGRPSRLRQLAAAITALLHARRPRRPEAMEEGVVIPGAKANPAPTNQSKARA